jgi:catechol 2,3-dioxygenase
LRRRKIKIVFACVIRANFQLRKPQPATMFGGMDSTLESHRAPIHIGSVTLRSRDMDGLAAFYERRIGLDRLAADAARISLGSGGVAYLHIEAAARGTAEPEGAAGLFHTAFLLPDRASLGRWFAAAHARGVRFEGASDHAVSEAFYLSDPDGNGIEVYHDRPRDEWRAEPDGGVRMTTAPMDVEGIVEAGRLAGGGAGRFPADSRIGHVHLKVGDAAEAQRYYMDALRFDVTHRRPPHAAFLSSGGYHHHLGVNTWMSRGAGRRDPEALGLAEIGLAVRDEALKAEIASRMGGNAFTDPWGNRLALN